MGIFPVQHYSPPERREEGDDNGATAGWVDTTTAAACRPRVDGIILYRTLGFG